MCIVMSHVSCVISTVHFQVLKIPTNTVVSTLPLLIYVQYRWDDCYSDVAILVDGTNCSVSTALLYLQSKNNHSEQNPTRPPVFRARLQPGVLCVTMIQLQQ